MLKDLLATGAPSKVSTAFCRYHVLALKSKKRSENLPPSITTPITIANIYPIKEPLL